jgi:hypothetical protein
MPTKQLHFASKDDYTKWKAKAHKNNKAKIYIRGKLHTIKHSKKK